VQTLGFGAAATATIKESTKIRKPL